MENRDEYPPPNNIDVVNFNIHIDDTQHEAD